MWKLIKSRGFSRHKLHLHVGPDHFFFKSLSLYSSYVDLMFSGNEFHMCVPSDLKLLFPNFVMFRGFGFRSFKFFKTLKAIARNL